MTSAHTAAIPLITQEVEQNHHQSPPQPQNDPAEPVLHQDDTKPKTPGSSRRGKQYKCGHCHELGHNQKTCPRRATAGTDPHSIHPALDAPADLFSGVASSVAPSLVGNGHHPPGPITRVQPAKIDAALEAANKRVVAADSAVANAKTEQEFEDATAQLDSAVRSLEKVAALAHRCAVVAHTLHGNWDSTQASVERDAKRMRLDTTPTPALAPATISLNEASTATATETVEVSEVVAVEVKDEPIV